LPLADGAIGQRLGLDVSTQAKVSQARLTVSNARRKVREKLLRWRAGKSF